MKHSLFTNIILFLLIILFIYAAGSKLTDRLHFEAALSKMAFIQNMAGFISVAVPVTELCTAALLCMPQTRLHGLYASLGLMIVFTIYIGYMILFAKHLPCNCGGILHKMNWTEHLVFNLCFIGLSAIGIKLNKTNKNIVATGRLHVQQPQGNR